MKKKPFMQPPPHKPRRIIVQPPEDLSAQEMEEAQIVEEAAPDAYRQGNFLIMHSPEDERAVVVDLNGKTVIHHLGTFGEITAMVTVLQGVRSQNQQVYEETFEELTDEEFIEEGMAALEDIMATDEPPMPDPGEVRDLLETLRGSFLDELIKPPKKKQ
jgi:hypothetical protein